MKTIEISGDKKIATVQKEFNDAFPFLKLEFFRKKHGLGGGSNRSEMIDAQLSFRKIPQKHSNGMIFLKEDMKVCELEDLFKNHFGLNVQVFRKSGRSWIETTLTDDWTLLQQNEEGRELSQLSD